MSGKDDQDRIREQLRRIERREFLRMAAGGALAASGVLGCGAGGSTGNDDGDDGNDGNNGGNTGGLTPAQRSTSIQAVLDKVNGAANQPRDTRLALLLDYLESRPEIIGSGRNEDGVWAIYQDGFPLMILDNRKPEDVPPDEVPPFSPALAGTNVPTSTRARFIRTRGSACINEIPRLARLVSAKGYAVVTDPGSIETLRTVTGDGIFYMGAHAGTCTIPDFDSFGRPLVDATGRATGLRSTFGVWTSSPWDPLNPNQYRGYIVAGQVGLGIEVDSVGPGGVDVYAAHYYITDQFVKDYMQFGENSLVWFAACWSNSGISTPFLIECLNKKAGLYVGWSDTVKDGAVIATGRFILDRLLGSNSTNPKETPPQRPFDYEQVWADLKKHGLHLHPNADGTRTTEIIGNVAYPGFGLLAPSIEYVLINELDDQAILKGIFGKEPPPSERAVLIGGLVAGLGGAWFTLETSGSFDDNMTSGRGFIALAALPFWTIPALRNFR